MLRLLKNVNFKEIPRTYLKSGKEFVYLIFSKFYNLYYYHLNNDNESVNWSLYYMSNKTCLNNHPV